MLRHTLLNLIHGWYFLTWDAGGRWYLAGLLVALVIGAALGAYNSWPLWALLVRSLY